jgi:hypothetical protein
MELDEACALAVHLDEEATWHADEEGAHDDLNEWDDFGADYAEQPAAPHDARRRRAAAWREATIEANQSDIAACALDESCALEMLHRQAEAEDMRAVEEAIAAMEEMRYLQSQSEAGPAPRTADEAHAMLRAGLAASIRELRRGPLR